MEQCIQTTAAADSQELAALLDAFQVTALGDGNATAGISQLAAMAIVLSNLARPGSGMVAPDGRLSPSALTTRRKPQPSEGCVPR